ncbi:MAG TPA: acetylxylan esterase [Fimbriimonas sp.]|nr:acetylxylan esterase [Fimbriimonas sp.]
MPLVDMPLAELEKYQGRNPRPADFDAYWDRAFRQLAETPPDVSIERHELSSKMADCFHLRFTGAGGSRIYSKLLVPKNLHARSPALLQFHGYTGNSGDWNDKLNYVSQGFVVAAMDCRGQGGRSEDLGGAKGNTHSGQIIRGLEDHEDKLYYRGVYLDTVRLAQIVMEMPEVDAARVGCTGGSQGGGLSLACAGLEPRIKKCAPWFPFLSDYQRTWEMDMGGSAYGEIKNYFRHFDPRHENQDAIFERLGYIDVQHLAPRIKAEVLMSVGLMDTTTLPSTCFAAYNKIPSKKRVSIYPDYGHEGLPGFGDMVFDFFSDL